MSACSPASESTVRQSIGRFSLDSESVHQWRLPTRLKEISGLALTPDDRLFAVDDEQGVVYELDYLNGRIVKAFALGNTTANADFEGIAYLNGKIYVVTSNGLIYVAAEGNDGERVHFDVYESGLGKLCEIEGLADDDQSDTLLIACKRSLGKHDRLSIFAWSPATGQVLDDREIVIPAGDIGERLGTKRIRPSAVVVDPESRTLFAVAAQQHAIIEMKPDGELIDAIILPLAKRHRQMEGIEITQDGKLLIADEGGNKKARLSVYSSGQNKAM